MIKQIRLKNFEKHKAFDAQFSEGLNIICGRTDAGKSAILRAISWVVRHDTLRTGTITHGETSLRVGVKTTGGTVVRFKDSTGYGYKAGGETFLACASQQPKEVSDALQLTDINIQMQEDPVFFLGLTPGKLAEEVNKIVDLGAIDKCSAWLKSNKTKTSTLAEAAKTKAASLAEQAKALDWVVAAQEAYTQLHTLATGIEHLHRKAESLTLQTDSIRTQQTQQQALRPLLEALDVYVFQAAVIQGAAHSAKTRKQALESILKELSACEGLDQLTLLRGDLGHLAVCEEDLRKKCERHLVLGSLVSGTRALPEKISKFSGLRVALEGIISQKTQTVGLLGKVTDIEKLVNSLKECYNAYPELIKTKADIEEKLGKCPTCGKPI
jgi:DNA repair exonuclease SbcCD ATPase subunit